MCIDFHHQVRLLMMMMMMMMVMLIFMMMMMLILMLLLQHPHMVVAGLHNGNVAVYNLQSDPGRPVYRSSAANGKHQDVVWKV